MTLELFPLTVKTYTICGLRGSNANASVDPALRGSAASGGDPALAAGLCEPERARAPRYPHRRRHARRSR